MINEVLEEVQSTMEATIEAIRRDLSRLRTGRANASMLEPVRVNYYGSMTALSQMASVTVPEARMLQVKPWDKSSITDIERALHEANLGVSPQNDGEVIRLIFPPTTEERRREFVKEAWIHIENGKVSIRNKRRDGNDMLKELEKEGEIGEDQLKRGLARVQELTDTNTKALDDLGKSKEEEILTV
jgi:ribosome recycling factor